MSLAAGLILSLFGATSFLFFVSCERDRRREILDRKATIKRQRAFKLADLSRRRRRQTRVAAGTEGPDAKEAAKILAAMMRESPAGT
ncbi:MAG: hypothetical protein HY720_19275 [Planctomycetes bacterium]|nr:hypothetical protein [Planctomycetota bacterium]